LIYRRPPPPPRTGRMVRERDILTKEHDQPGHEGQKVRSKMIILATVFGRKGLGPMITKGYTFGGRWEGRRIKKGEGERRKGKERKKGKKGKKKKRKQEAVRFASKADIRWREHRSVRSDYHDASGFVKKGEKKLKASISKIRCAKLQTGEVSRGRRINGFTIDREKNLPLRGALLAERSVRWATGRQRFSSVSRAAQGLDVLPFLWMPRCRSEQSNGRLEFLRAIRGRQMDSISWEIRWL